MELRDGTWTQRLPDISARAIAVTLPPGDLDTTQLTSEASMLTTGWPTDRSPQQRDRVLLADLAVGVLDDMPLPASEPLQDS